MQNIADEPIQVILPEPSSPSTLDLSIVIPCFNECETISATVHTVVDFIRANYPNKSYEVLLIDDGSTDGTPELLRVLEKSLPQVRPLFFVTNRGRGAAVKTGLQAARGSYVIPLDADLTYDVQHIADIFSVFEANPKVDVVVVSPYMAGGVAEGVPLNRLILSRMANWILAGFFSNRLSTVTCVVRGYRQERLEGLPLLEEGKEFHLEILRKLTLVGANIVEIPGRLRWKQTKQQPRRKNNLKVFQAAERHIWYGLLVKPTRIFKYVALALCLVGIYELGAIATSAISNFQYNGEFWHSAWRALSASYHHSPHTFIIAGVSLILGFQTFSFLAIFQVLKLQQEETLRHMMALYAQQAKAPSITTVH
jgi:glycosyltransferase involved in cell wall biosynthesis